MAQSEVHPILGACQHLRGRYKLQASHRSPFPEKRFLRHECERGVDLTEMGEEDIQKCFDQQIGCWREEE